jgi:hypothetical protein
LSAEVAHFEGVDPEALGVQVFERALDASWDLRRRDYEHKRSRLERCSEIPRDDIGADDLVFVDIVSSPE